MNPTVHSLVLSAVDWNEVCPWLLFRKSLCLAFSFRLLLLMTFHLLIVSLWLAAAFDWFSSSRTIEDLLKDYSCITAYVPHTETSSPFAGPVLQTLESQSEKTFSKEKTGDDLRLEMLAIQGMNVPAANPDPQPAQESVSVLSSPQEKLPAQTTLSHSSESAEPLGISKILNRVGAVSYAFFSTLLLWLITVRLTALRVTREFRSSFQHELQFSFKQISRVLTAFFWIVLGTVLLALPLLACRLFPADVTAWLMPAALVYSVFYLFFLLGTGLGTFFIPSVLATENSDAFDALSRSCAYALQKPLKLLLYLLAAAVFGVLGLSILVVFVIAVEHLCLTLTGVDSRGVSLMLYAFSWSISAYLFLYSVSAIEGLYLLLRRDVDAVELETIWLPEPQGVPAPQLPKLEETAKETA